MHTYRRTDWCPHGLTMTVRDGIVHPSGGVTDECTRPAAIVAAENARGV